MQSQAKALFTANDFINHPNFQCLVCMCGLTGFFYAYNEFYYGMPSDYDPLLPRLSEKEKDRRKKFLEERRASRTGKPTHIAPKRYGPDTPWAKGIYDPDPFPNQFRWLVKMKKIRQKQSGTKEEKKPKDGPSVERALERHRKSTLWKPVAPRKIVPPKQELVPEFCFSLPEYLPEAKIGNSEPNQKQQDQKQPEAVAEESNQKPQAVTSVLNENGVRRRTSKKVVPVKKGGKKNKNKNNSKSKKKKNQKKKGKR